MSVDRDRILSELMVLRYRRGDRSALDALIRHWENRLLYYIIQLVGSEEDAWDALQEVWVSLTRGVRRLRNPGALGAWLYRTARNKALDRLRDRYRSLTVPLECEEALEIEQPQETLAFEDAEMVHAGLAKLPVGQREVLTLFFLDDLSIDETAFVLEVAPGTVKSRLHHAKKALRKVLEEEVAP